MLLALPTSEEGKYSAPYTHFLLDPSSCPIDRLDHGKKYSEGHDISREKMSVLTMGKLDGG